MIKVFVLGTDKPWRSDIIIEQGLDNSDCLERVNTPEEADFIMFPCHSYDLNVKVNNPVLNRCPRSKTIFNKIRFNKSKGSRLFF